MVKILLSLILALSSSANYDLDKDMTMEEGLILSSEAVKDGKIDKAFEVWEILCNKKDGLSCFNLGFHEEVEGKVDQAISYYEESCRNKFNSGCDKAKSLKNSGGVDGLLKKSCEAGDKSSCETLKLLREYNY